MDNWLYPPGVGVTCNQAGGTVIPGQGPLILVHLDFRSWRWIGKKDQDDLWMRLSGMIDQDDLGDGA